jgi:hypothetical protein
MPKIVLLGDSAFDNERYVEEGSAVAEHLQRMLGKKREVELLAVDGAVVNNVPGQIDRIPADATHLFLSAGGNDALRLLPVLEQAADTVFDVLTKFSYLSAEFRRQYAELIEALKAKGLPLTLCTIYRGFPQDGFYFSDEAHYECAQMALRFFNDAIISEAIESRLPLIDLRHVVNESDDYVQSIEPSARGGRKIALAISRLLAAHNFEANRCCVYV